MGQHQSCRYRRANDVETKGNELGDLPRPNDELDGQHELSTKLRNVDEVNDWLDTGADPTECDKMGRNALHHACRHEVSKEADVKGVLTSLITRGCDRVINDTDSEGHTALFYAIDNGNDIAAVKLVESGADFCTRTKEKGNTAFHEACLAGLLKVVETMLRCAPTSGPNPVKLKGHKNETPLHAACKNSNLLVVKKLLENKADIFAKDDVGKTPLHAAARGCKVDGTIETVNYLLEHGAMKILNEPTSELSEEDRKTPLSTACFYGQDETVKFLLSKEAVADANCMKFAVENDFGRTVGALVRSSQWKECLRTTLNGEPIFNEIIRRWPEVALNVLDKCTVRRSQKLKEKGCIAFNFEFLECFHEKGASFEDKSSTQREDCVDFDDPAERHAKKDMALKEKEFEDVKKQRKTFFGPKEWSPTKLNFTKSHHPLSVIVKGGDERHDRLLTHPVVRALLHYKWRHHGIRFYLVNVFIFSLFLALATSLALSVGNPLSPDCPMQGNGTCDFTERRKNRVISVASLTIVFAVLHLGIRIIKELIRMFELRKKYFTNICLLFDLTYVLSNLFDLMEVFSYLLISVFAAMIFHYDCPCPEEWQWQVGIIGLFFAWLTLLKFANKFPFISKYVLMLGRIIETFVKVSFIGVPLIFAFAWPFYMALYDPEVTRSPFQNPGIAIIKVLSMTTGNFDYDNTFRRDLSMESEFVTELPYLPATYILWITFVILMPLLLNNLLVGLAVGDIKSVEEEAELRELKLKAELVLGFEALLPSYLRSRWRCGRKLVYPWKERNRAEWRRPKHECIPSLLQVFERRKDLQNQAWPNNKQTTEQGKDDQARLKRMEDTLQKITDALNINMI